MSVLASLLREKRTERKVLFLTRKITPKNFSITWAFFLSSFAKTVWPNGKTGSKSNFHLILVVDGKLA